MHSVKQMGWGSAGIQVGDRIIDQLPINYRELTIGSKNNITQLRCEVSAWLSEINASSTDPSFRFMFRPYKSHYGKVLQLRSEGLQAPPKLCCTTVMMPEWKKTLFWFSQWVLPKIGTMCLFGALPLWKMGMRIASNCVFKTCNFDKQRYADSTERNG